MRSRGYKISYDSNGAQYGTDYCPESMDISVMRAAHRTIAYATARYSVVYSTAPSVRAR